MAIGNNVINAPKLASYQFCPYSAHLDDIIKERGLPMTALTAANAWLKISFRKLPPDELYVGENLIHIEDLPSEKLPKYLTYKSAESFASARSGWWKQHIIVNNGELYDRKIAWRYRNQWWKPDELNEKGDIIRLNNGVRTIERACFNYYNHAAENGLPILDYIDKKVAFYFEGTKYEVTFSEVRKGLIVGDQDTKKRSQRELDKDWQITMQIFAFSQLARDYEAYRWKWGIPSNNWEGILMPEAKFVYYNLLTNEKLVTTRIDSDLESVLREISAIQEKLKQSNKDGIFLPNHKSCYVCKYNVIGADNKQVCNESKPGTKPLKTKALLEKNG